MYRPRIVQLVGEKEYLNPGHQACHGCGAVLGLRYVLKAAGENTILVVPAGCTSIYAGTFAKATFKVPFLHSPFGGAAALGSGVARALEALGKTHINVIVWAGDGATADIGLASLSGAAERGENFLYILNDNEAYMNTGIQRSGGTPRGAWTTTTMLGKEEPKKDVWGIVLSHEIRYAATACVSYPMDLYNKVKKALSYRGFKFIHLLSPCPPGWRYEADLTIEIGRLAVMSGAWILMEWDGGKLTLNPPSSTLLKGKKVPIEEYLKLQGRFKGVKPELIEMFKRDVENRWKYVESILKSQGG